MVVGIYLAAGQSSRMGCDKLALPLGDRPLGSVALRTALASRLDSVLVVIKQEDALQWVAPELWAAPRRCKWQAIPCADAERGQASSLKYGVLAAQAMQAEAVLVLLADQPFVTQEMIDAILQEERTTGQQYVAAGYQGIARPPVLFDAALFPMLLQLQGDEGARRILRNGFSKGKVLEYDQGRIFWDVDTEADYRAVLEGNF